MKLHLKTYVLLAVAVVLAALNAWTVSPAAAPTALPSLPGVIPDDVTKIVISSPIERLELNRTAFEKGKPEAERWQIVAPLDYAADVAQVRALLRVYGLAVPMDARIDEGNLKDYQLEDQDAKVVELYTTGATPALQVSVGRTVGPNTSFVRLPGANTVYRAGVGPRERYDQAAADWRDRVVLDVPAASVTRLVLRRAEDELTFDRGAAGAWAVASSTQTKPFAVDAETVESVVRTLGRIRAGDIHNAAFPGGFEAPIGSATITAGAEVHTLTLGSESTPKSAYVKVDNRPEVFQVSGQLGRLLMLPLTGFRDRGIFRFNAEALSGLTLTEGSITIAIQRGDDGWTVTQPANMDVDSKLADGLAAALGGLRAAAIPEDNAFASVTGRLLLQKKDGSTEKLEIGPAEKDAEGHALVRVRTASGVYLLPAATLREIERVFGR
jgi:hypothetical protein